MGDLSDSIATMTTRLICLKRCLERKRNHSVVYTITGRTIVSLKRRRKWSHCVCVPFSVVDVNCGTAIAERCHSTGWRKIKRKYKNQRYLNGAATFTEPLTQTGTRFNWSLRSRVAYFTGTTPADIKQPVFYYHYYFLYFSSFIFVGANIWHIY